MLIVSLYYIYFLILKNDELAEISFLKNYISQEKLHTIILFSFFFDNKFKPIYF